MPSRPDRGLLAALCCGIAALIGGPARAHPFDADLYGQQIDVLVDQGEVRLRVASEVPSRVIVEDLIRRTGSARRTPAEVEAFHALWLAELIDGFAAHRDGAAVEWTRRPPPELSAELQARFAIYRFELATALSPGALHTINLVDHNFPDQRAVRLLNLQVDQRWRLDACSLIEAGPDGTLDDRTGRWGQLAADRELRLTVQPRPWWRWQLGRLGRLLRGAAPDAPLPAREALIAEDQTDVMRGVFGLSLGTVLGAAPTLLAGLWWRRRKTRAGGLDA